jgi:hypothetical protein
MEEKEKEEIWDDGLHFTPAGYERMGEFVAGRLIEIISEGTKKEGVKEGEAKEEEAKEEN